MVPMTRVDSTRCNIHCIINNRKGGKTRKNDLRCSKHGRRYGRYRRKQILTLENICVIGLVTLILSKPAIHKRKPNIPVVILTHTKTCELHSWPSDPSAKSCMTRKGSPFSNMNGARRIAEPRFVQYASLMVLPEQ